MFRYCIRGKVNGLDRPVTLALTGYSDLAAYIRDHAVEALDPDGEHGFSVELVETPDAFVRTLPRRRTSKEE